MEAALLHAVAMARTAVLSACAGLEDGPLARARHAAEIARLRCEVACLREELRIKDVRLGRLSAHQRPHYAPTERLAILALRAAAGWSAAQTARRFLVAPATIAAWAKRLDEEGPDALVRTPQPVNRFPELVAELVAALRATVPSMGKVRIAQVLARAGLQLAPTTVARFLKESPRGPREKPTMRVVAREHRGAVDERRRVVTAQYPHHLWHVDLTVIPTAAGFWVPWIPGAVPIIWPFAWTVAVVLDHHSRAVVAHAVYRKQPTAEQVCALLDRAILDAGRTPRHIVTDRGVQFEAAQYLEWCRRRRVRPRFGAVGRKGSIAVVERFMRSLKSEHLRRILVPLGRTVFRREVALYVDWYNRCRPHSSLEGRTPAERLRRTPAVTSLLETRPRYPLRRRGRKRRRRLRGTLKLVIDHSQGRPHLPIVSLREAA